jgi:hypothetical protein
VVPTNNLKKKPSCVHNGTVCFNVYVQDRTRNNFSRHAEIICNGGAGIICKVGAGIIRKVRAGTVCISKCARLKIEPRINFQDMLE